MMNRCGTVETLKKHINIATDYILREIQNVDAILLAGSYGRNEGAWIETEQGLKPYNDYDFIVVSDAPGLDKNQINALRAKCADKIGISWVDIDIYTHTKINRMKCTQKNVDIAYGSCLLYGNPIQWDVRKLAMDRLTFFDIETLYFTRMWAFFGTYQYISKEVDTEDSSFFRYQMAKVILACADMVLIKNRKYHYSYKERYERIKNIKEFNGNTHLYDFAIKEKLNPSTTKSSPEEMEKMYNDVMTLFVKSIRYSLGWRSVVYTNSFLFRIFYMMRPTSVLLRTRGVIRKDGGYQEKYQKMMILQNQLFNDLSKGKDLNIKKYGDKIAAVGFGEFAITTTEDIVDTIARIRNLL